MHRLLSALLGIALAASQVTAARADVVADLYSAEVPVADRSAQTLAGAAGDALGEVLVKVSGSEAVLGNPAVREAMKSARAQVLQYAYRQGEEPGALYARFEFDDAFVTDLVVRSGEPLWTANRPRVLLWLVFEDVAGRRFVNPETMPELVSELADEFSRRGVPMQLPLYDLADAAAISAEEAWRLRGPALESASQRYRVEHVLAGRLAALSDGNWVGDWSYLHDRDRSDRAFTAPSSRAFAREGAAMVAESMAGRYAVAATADPGAGVVMLVSGITRYADYAQIVSWLEDLELVEHANVEQIRGDQIVLRLHAQAEAAQLGSVIELNRRLQPLAVPSPGAQLSYQWRN